MDKQKKSAADVENVWGDGIKQDGLWRILEFVTESDEVFFKKITKGLTEEEIEEYLQEFPEYRKYWNKEENSIE